MASRRTRNSARGDGNLAVEQRQPLPSPPVAQVEQLGANVANQLLQIIQQQQQDLLALRNAQATRDAAVQAEAQRVASEKALFIQQVNTIEASGAIYGYNGDVPLTNEEEQFHELVKGLGVNKITADELFRQGISSIGEVKLMDVDKLKTVFYNARKNHSPSCPNPKELFIGAVFENKMSILTSWIRFQENMGVTPTAQGWNNNPDAYKLTLERVNYLRQVKESEGSEDIKLPEPLKEMKKFKEFSEHLTTYLRTKRGAVNVPLVYAIREGETVSDEDRSGSVGIDPGDTYRNWDEYAIRCVSLSGTHWESDNASFWQILSRLVRDGPGWDYIRSFEKKGDGDGRKAYLKLYSHANEYTNVRGIKSEARTLLRELRYEGDRRNFNWDKFIRLRYRSINTLKTHNACPDDEELVEDLCRNIDEPRLNPSLPQVLVKGSPYVDDYNAAQQYLTNVLTCHRQNIKSGKRDRNVSAFGKENKRQRDTFSGKLEAKDYAPNDWASMTNKQRDVVRKLRKEKWQKNNRNASATNSDNTNVKEEAKQATSQFGRAAHEKKKEKA